MTVIPLAALYPGRPAAEIGRGRTSAEAGPGGHDPARCRIGQTEEFPATMQTEWARERIHEVNERYRAGRPSRW